MQATLKAAIPDDQLEIHEASWRDVFAIHSLGRRCFDADAWPWLDYLAALTAPGAIRWKALVGSEIVGYVIGDRRGKGIGWIASIAVNPDHRRQGIASELMRVAESKLGTSIFRLTLRRSNRAALHLYRRSGYLEVDVWPNYYYDGEDGLVMEKAAAGNEL
jgi:ribosomal-protein-alanine N-acetyltransferase